MASPYEQSDSRLKVMPATQDLYQANDQKEVAPIPGLEVVSPSFDQKQVVPSYGFEHAPIPKEYYSQEEATGHRPHSLLRRRWLLLGGAILLIIIVAAVLGGVLGSRKRTSATSPSGPANTTTSNSTTGSNSTSARQFQHNIAAISYANNSINTTRVYYQDNLGQLWEAASDAQDSAWTSTPLGVYAVNGSAIAAAVSQPGFPFKIDVYYIGTNPTEVIQDIIYSASTNTWSAGTVSSQNYIAATDSSLSALYMQCAMCANTTIIAFQDENNDVQIGNFTSNGWTALQQPDMNSEPGTGLALQLMDLGGNFEQINLYYQQASTLNLTLAIWTPPVENTANDGRSWTIQSQVYGNITAAAHITACASYSKSSTNYPSWIEVLWVDGNSSVGVNTWSGNINDWLQGYYHPSVMQIPSTISGKFINSVAVTAIGHAFMALKDSVNGDSIQSYAVQDDSVNWVSTGTVDIGSAWN